MKKNKTLSPFAAKKCLFRSGRILDPLNNLDQQSDLLIEDGKIKTIGSVNSKSFAGIVVDCQGKTITPGFMDMHVHLREPGREDKETIESGCLAAMAGGFTAVCCMPNTHPVTDSRGHVEFIKKRAEGFLVDVHPIGAITKGLNGEELTEMGDMLQAGAVGFSDDGYPVSTASIMRNALEYISMFDVPIIEHCELLNLTLNGMMNEGFVSTFLGMKGIPSISESIHVARDLYLAEYTGGKIHIAHVSTMEAVSLIRNAKKKGVRVTAETCPHYLVLTDEAVRGYDTNTKMKPPLRTEQDRQALLKGLSDGTIDVIATDHAPHTIDDKEVEYNVAAFGIVGLETAVGIILTNVVKNNILSLSDMIQKMAIQPRNILGLPQKGVRIGESANLTILDIEFSWKVDKTRFLSKSRNTPFHGWELEGRSIGVYNNGQLFLME
jgi:dihydroorotase